MNFRYQLCFAALFLVAGASTAAAQGLVECPVSQIEARVTTKLPSDWWTTPQVGKLVGTEAIRVGGDPTLVCKYRAFGTDVSVMRKAPGNAKCAARPTGFECSGSGRRTASVSGGFRAEAGTKVQDNSVKVETGVSARPPGTVTPSASRPGPGKVDTGKRPTVKYSGSCPDPMLDGIEVRYVTLDPATNTYAFRLVGVVRNAGRANFATAAGQQVVDLYQLPRGGSARRLQSWAFGSIPAGGSASESAYDVLRWRLSDEFPPSFRFSITYEPDIRTDGNKSNDDCQMGNNSTTITGEQINAAIRASGI